MSTNPLIRNLERHGPLTEEEKRVIEDAVSHVAEYGPDAEIVAEGECPSSSKLIVEGFAYRYKTLPDGRRQITAFHVPGDFADLHSFLLKKMDDGVSSFTRCKVASVPHEKLMEITRSYPYLTRLFWMTTLVDGAVHREWMTSIGILSARERVAHILCEMSVRLKAVGLANDNSYELPITQEEMSDAFGMTGVHMNRMLTELKDEKLITGKGKMLTILDWDRLRQVASFNPDYLHLDQKLERD